MSSFTSFAKPVGAKSRAFLDKWSSPFSVRETTQAQRYLESLLSGANLLSESLPGEIVILEGIFTALTFEVDPKSLTGVFDDGTAILKIVWEKRVDPPALRKRVKLKGILLKDECLYMKNPVVEEIL